MWLSPISPSSSAFGTSAATESTTTMSTAPVATSALGDLQRLLAVVRLRNEQVVHVYAELRAHSRDRARARRR